MGFGGGSSVTTQDIDPDVKARNLALYGQTQEYLTDTPWEQYPYQQVAGFQPFQLAGQGLLASSIFGPGAYQNYGLGYQPPMTGAFEQQWQGFAPYQDEYTPGSVYPEGYKPGGAVTGTAQPRNAQSPSSTMQLQAPEGYMGSSAESAGISPEAFQQALAGAPPGSYIDYNAAGYPIIKPDGNRDYPYYGTPAQQAQLPKTTSASYQPGLMNVVDPNPNDQYEPVTPPGGGGGGDTDTDWIEGYGPYEGEFQMPAFQLSRALGLNQMGQAAGLAGMQGVSTPGMEQFYNPFMNQVVGQSISDLDRARQLTQLGTAAQATQAGAFGGDRQAIENAETNRAFLEQVGRTSGQLRSAGFDTAAQLAQQNAQRQLQATGLLGQLGQGIQGGVLNYANALMGAGGQQQALSQAAIDRNMQDFNQARDYPIRGIQLQQGVLQGMPVGLSYTQQQNTSPWSAILGAGATLGGLLL